MSATTEMNRAAGLPFSTLDQIRAGQAVYHDFTNSSLIAAGFDLPLFSPAQAAKILGEQSQFYDLLLYEYFLTDIAGHAQNMTQAVDEIKKTEALIGDLLQQINLDRTLVMVVSDHGNLEDLRTKSHTHNPAYLGIWARENHHTFGTLMDIAPFIIRLLT
jgi:bisphosphoglycerate-independent phosphoglycerate mutase (AlkP superfamily)